jgi:hypothetical protein
MTLACYIFVDISEGKTPTKLRFEMLEPLAAGLASVLDLPLFGWRGCSADQGSVSRHENFDEVTEPRYDTDRQNLKTLVDDKGQKGSARRICEHGSRGAIELLFAARRTPSLLAEPDGRITMQIRRLRNAGVRQGRTRHAAVGFVTSASREEISS